MTAAAQRRTVRTGLLSEDPRWPRFGRRVSHLGVQSALSLPLMVGEAVVGAMNVYSRERDAFGGHAMELGEAFAGPAAVAVRNAHMLERARRLSVQLQTALTGQAIIDQAVGIVMSRRGITAVEAYASMRRLNQSENIKLDVAAQRLVDEAARRAGSRRRR